MKAYRIRKFGYVNGLVVREHDEPVPAPNEVIVRIRAATLIHWTSLVAGFHQNVLLAAIRSLPFR